jgi:MFS family permease
VILGYGVGACAGGVPLYVAELSPPAIRGRIVAIEQMILCLGELVAFWINYGFNFLETKDWWRIPLAIQIVPAIVLGIGCWFWVPPSPRWLASQDRHDCAQEVLIRLHGSEAAELEMQEIMSSIEFEHTVSEASWGDMFTMPVLRVTLLGMTVQFFQQITGTNSILYYTVSGYHQLYTSPTLTTTAITVRTWWNQRSSHRQLSHRRRWHRTLRLLLDSNLLLRPPRSKDLATNRHRRHDGRYDWHHRVAVAC